MAYQSRKLQGPELSYTTTDLELPASVHAVATWRCFLEGLPASQVTLITDRYPNTCLPTQPEMSKRQARWSEFLQRFNFKWEYRPGRQNVADPISRYPQSVQSDSQVSDQFLGAIAQSSTQVANVPAWLQHCLAGSRTLKVGAVDPYTIDSWFVKNQHRFTHEAGFYFHEGRLVLPDTANVGTKGI